jgi:iron complex outermembrane recepter protein
MSTPALKTKTCLRAFFTATFIASFFVSYAQNGIVKGKILSDKQPLSFATITVGHQHTISNESGEFSVSMSPGRYNLAVTYTGYQKYEQSINVAVNETVTLEINMLADKGAMHVVVLGSRSGIARSTLTTAVPVDVIPASALPKNEIDVDKMLTMIVPSFNSPPQTNGLTAHTNPATLRGLGPDETLVLINGRRRHNSAFIYVQKTMGYGSAGTDLNAIPAAAIDTIEVLRDGASAQYGSDAIAGVINLELKKSTGVTTLNLHLGQYYKGDGETAAFDINTGFRLFKKGFINFTTELRYRNSTQRNGEYQGSVYYNVPLNAPDRVRDSLLALDSAEIARRGFSRKDHSPIGTPQFKTVSSVLNGAYSFNNNLRLFWTGTVCYRLSSKGNATYRYPKETASVITELFPDGFRSNGRYNIWDFSGIVGAEGIINHKWLWDVSSTYGGNSHDFNISNVNNASQFALGANAQTSFYDGMLLFRQNTNNINFSRNIGENLKRIKSFTVAFGGELRIDNYQIKQGEEASYFNYAPLSGRVGGAQALPGYGPEDAINKNRYVSAAYAELEMDKNEHFLWNASGRYEHYSDFGGNLAGKVSMRYKVSDLLSIRGSISNGFRAPSIQQRYYSSVSQITQLGKLYVTGTYRNGTEVADAFGIQPLQAETSINASGGITSKLSNHINITMDGYWIQIRNRVIYTGLIPRDTSQVPRPGGTSRIAQIVDSLGRKDISAVRFFTNAVNTRTLGIDAVATGTWPIRKSVVEVSLSANLTKTIVFGKVQTAKNLPDSAQYNSLLFSREEKGRIEQGQPGKKVILSVIYKTGRWEFSTRNIYFGKVASLNTIDSLDEVFNSKVISGARTTYSFNKGISLTAGAANIFNVYPDKLQHYGNTNNGLAIYSSLVTQFGYNGGYYFLVMEWKF